MTTCAPGEVSPQLMDCMSGGLGLSLLLLDKPSHQSN
jgi:hypothetical protein